MDLLVVDEIMAENIELLDRATTGIRHCLPVYENACSELINEIGKCDSVSEANQIFDTLIEIQNILYILIYKYNFDIGSKLGVLTKEFDRLHDPYIREYWYKMFRKGVLWPDSML